MVWRLASSLHRGLVPARRSTGFMSMLLTSTWCVLSISSLLILPCFHHPFHPSLPFLVHLQSWRLTVIHRTIGSRLPCRKAHIQYITRWLRDSDCVRGASLLFLLHKDHLVVIRRLASSWRKGLVPSGKPTDVSLRSHTLSLLWCVAYGNIVKLT